MPMVIIACPGMVSNGFAQTLERPGGIYTGIDELPTGATAKRLTFLKTTAPSVTRVALLSTTPGTGGHERQLGETERTAVTLGISVKAYRAASRRDLEGALASIAADGMNGLLNFQGGLSLAYRQQIADFAADRRIPAIYQATLFAEAGGLTTWAPNLHLQFREGARLIAKILNGAKPGDLAVKHPATYSLMINTGAARRIGLTLPPTVLASATRVIL
jgi:putative ABC transport system substrate-binding protein